MTTYNDIMLEEVKKNFLSKGLPEYMWPGVKNWLKYGQIPGHFLSAVISHDLFDCINRGDQFNQSHLKEWVWFFYNDVDGRCHGKNALETWPKHVEEVELTEIPKQFKREEGRADER
jgi:hypothetical protein